MSVKISELPEVTSLNGNSLLEVAVPNPASPTGFVTRSAKASLFGGSGGDIPFRFPFEAQDVIVSSEGTFEITFELSQFLSTALRPNEPDSTNLASMLSDFNFIGAVAYTEPDGGMEYNNLFMCNSRAWINRVNNNDGNKFVLGTFDSGEGQVIDSGWVAQNYLNSTYAAHPYGVQVYDNDADTEIVFTFRLVGPYSSNGKTVDKVSFRGYVDATTLLMFWYQPT